MPSNRVVARIGPLWDNMFDESIGSMFCGFVKIRAGSALPGNIKGIAQNKPDSKPSWVNQTYIHLESIGWSVIYWWNQTMRFASFQTLSVGGE